MTELLQFPAGFAWGAATAAYQIEGAVHEDGRGPSIWDTFAHAPGATLNGDTGDVACDHYHRWPQDIALMRELGLQAYRFSIAWPRILPGGRGQVNVAGLDFYDRLVDGLLAAGIDPYVTLYHWDLPQPLQEQGGWLNRDTSKAFADYAQVVAARLGDRVHHWITHNEPLVVAYFGHWMGFHPPGRHDPAAATQAAHHLLLSHGLALPALRAAGDSQTQVGITLVLQPVYPASSSEADLAVARREEIIWLKWFMDPLFKGAYPLEEMEAHGLPQPTIEAGDMERISQPTDFLGVNYYTRIIARGSTNSGDIEEQDEHTTMGWEVFPDGLRVLLERVQHDYAPKAVYITENGAAFQDTLREDGTVEDERRRRYLQQHFGAAHQAIQAGVPLRGYFVWSLLDNFEWTFGYSQRFGIVYTDYATQQRHIKKSGYFYRDVIARNGVPRG
ncbi:MAG TPA: GH1 family beta-glucosidase [Ktedonobacterales bacterium]